MRIPMQADELTMAAKVKSQPFIIDPHVVREQPNLRLDCLDHANRRAFFVDTPHEVDLLQTPFYCIAQDEAAQQLVAVPVDTLPAPAREAVVDPQRIILFYSTGPCGSTLFSHVLNQNPAIGSFSGPDIFSQLVLLRTVGQSNDAGITTLLYDSRMIMSANAQQHGYQYWAFKFRSWVLSVSDLLYQVLPEAKLIFLYRNALTWTRSFSRAFGALNAELKERWVKDGFRYMIPSVDTDLRTHTHTISGIEYSAHMWISTIQDSRRLQQQGAALAWARFEDLKVARRAPIQLLQTQCSLPMPDPDRPAQVFCQRLPSRDGGRSGYGRACTPAELAALDPIIRESAPSLAPDAILS